MTGASPVGRFPRAQHIRKHAEFQAAQAHGRRVRTEHFILLVAANQPEGRPTAARLGIVASKKIGHAVHRNRARRLVREAFRATRDLWSAGIDLVVIVRTPLATMKLVDVVNEWRGAARHIERQTARALEQSPQSPQTDSPAREPGVRRQARAD